ncbi:OmpA family protein [Gracilimonas sp.]|uniref:OmpA family protein n=1 Tax=Gracilimonas sp. TaxID=1974203 RepID=UPI00287162C8|nr:OmpA family protein [Gracilimonas sp.]
MNQSNAQTAENRTWLTTYIGVNEVNSDNFNEHFGFRWGNDLGGGVGLRYYLNNNFDAELGFFMSRVDDEIRWTQDYYNTSLLFHYKLANGTLFSESSVIRPFLTAGTGFSLYRGGNVANTQGLEVPLGLGIDIPLGKRVSLTSNMLYTLTFNDDIDGDRVKSFRTPDDTPDNIILYKAGFKFNLGPRDKDGDGVNDGMDICPDVAGDPAYDGCPDSDGDMVPDYKDRCPNLAGTEATGGCPDRDGDSIIDSEDQCPDVAGSAEFNGCADSDNDGIVYSNDQCPNVAGSEGMNGCPDSDNDGIADAEDNCPNIAGDASTGGCPDSDNDGVINSEDQCPNVAGERDFDGCPGLARANELAEAVNNELRFNFDESTIHNQYQANLNSLGDFLADYHSFEIVIAGYTDNLGSIAYNKELSKERAEAVKAYLVNRGVDASQITTTGLGQQDPIATNETEEERQENRRVLITVSSTE